jgi:hypothetical protein
MRRQPAIASIGGAVTLRTMERSDILSSLIRFDKPIAELEALVAELDWDATPAASLRRTDIAAVIERYLGGQIDPGDVARWANLIESREDIAFEQRHEPAVADAIFDLANPDLQGELAEISADILASLQP